MKLAAFLLGVLYAFAILLAFVAPFGLVIIFPDSADSIADLYGTLVPWFVLFVLALLFKTQIESFFIGIATALARIRSFRAGGTTTEFDHDQSAAILSTAQAAAWSWYLRFVAATIFGSQVVALEALEHEGQRAKEDFINDYLEYLKRGGDKQYTFDAYIAYMEQQAVLMRRDETSGRYVLTTEGQQFLNALRAANIPASGFRF